MKMHGKNHIGYTLSGLGTTSFRAFYPATGDMSDYAYIQATPEETEQALLLAGAAFPVYSALPASAKAKFLNAIAEEIEADAEAIIAMAVKESGLPEARIRSEKSRTTGQLQMFARLLLHGYGAEITIETALPDRVPAPRPDLRKMRKGLGPVVVFTASNFPLAFSTAGGDTASALAAGCPVIVKCHESHPGTNALVADAILRAAQKTGMPDGVFSSLQGVGYDLGTSLVLDPGVKAVAFTGSFQGGYALYRHAAQREEPIPVFAEMGSVNPVFILKNYLKNNIISLANSLSTSVQMGAGQFCTNPGLLVVEKSDSLGPFLDNLAEKFASAEGQIMLNKQIHTHYTKAVTALGNDELVTLLSSGQIANDSPLPLARGSVGIISAIDFLENSSYQKEVFGPYSLCVVCESQEEMELVALELEGQLTASVWLEKEDEKQASVLLPMLEDKVGRIIINQVPTGVDVGLAMHHGGPFPASTDSRFTSVGADAIKRFTRPVCYQNFPDELLPDELKRTNPLGLTRTINGVNSNEKA